MRRKRLWPCAVLAALVAAPGGCQKKGSDPGEHLVDSGLPGAPRIRASLANRLAAAVAARGGAAPRYTNRLILEDSPYLQQHAHNPVNWYPWGDEAFAAARRLHRPVFLSIGYSTCHWCHVMEAESFSDPEIARALNENYIAIKVDREERPDIDAVYMAAVEAMGGSTGWPLNVWLTPDRRPFFGGTYFPPRAGVRGGRVGLLDILERGKKEYDENRERIDEMARRVAAAVKRLGAVDAAEAPPGEEVVAAAARDVRRSFDRVDGGFRPTARDRSKFPGAFPVRMLLRRARRAQSAEAAEAAELRGMVSLTLEKMAAGGVHDQLGGGFHRYSTDPAWRVPHFEKMLYDNARLAVVYLEAYQALGEPRFAAVAADILGYVRREMTAPGGGFYSASDADSPGPGGEPTEGAFYVWTADQIRAALPEADAELAIARYGVTAAGDLEGGRNVLYAARSAAELGATPARLEAIRRALYRRRSRRPPPPRDDKIVAGWNGLMISAFARAATVIGADHPELQCLETARRAAAFVTGEMIQGGRLRRAFAAGRAAGDAFSDDYASLIAGLLDLFEAGGEPKWLERAAALQETLDAHYRSPDGAYFQSADDAEALLARAIIRRDGALPSASSVAALDLLRLAALRGDDRYRAAAVRLLAAFRPRLEADPTSLAAMLLAVDWRAAGGREIVLLAPHSLAELAPLEAALKSRFVPGAVVVRARQGDARLFAAVPPLAGKVALGGRPTAYVCERGRCRLPTADPEVFAKQLEMVSAPDDRGGAEPGAGEQEQPQKDRADAKGDPGGVDRR